MKKDLYEIEEKEMGSGYENDYQSGSYRGGNSYRGSGYSRRNNSYNMMPRYNSGGYSMDNDDDSSYMHLEEAMKHAKSEQEREAIRKLMNQNYR